MADPWAVLGVARDASSDEIRAAYRRLAARHHPDVPGGSERRMAEINAAYAALRADRVELPAAATASAPRPVQHAGSMRSYGCGLTAAIALVIAAVTVAVAVALTRDRDGAADVAGSPAVATTSTVRRIAEPAPWTGPRLDPSAARLAVSVWQRSPARAECPLLIPAGADDGGTARVVDTAGGWGVAWGRVNEPDLFGVTARPGTREDRDEDGDALLTWSDGSRASLRRDDDRLVAGLDIAGVACAYDIFSTVGFDNLAEVLGALRFVDT